MNLVIIGSGGRLGGALARHFRQRGHAVVAFDHKGLDLARAEIIRDRIEPLAFDAVIITAALTGLEDCEARPDEARAVNADGPALVADLCVRRGARLIHISTNYVYDGTRPGLRTEDDPAVPLGVYARTKLEGEKWVLERTHGAALVVRTSWIFGPDRPAFPDMMIERAQKSERVEAVADTFSTPCYSHDFAAHIEPLLADPSIRGIVNLANSGACSWQGFAQTTLDIAAAMGLPLRCCKVMPLRLVDMKGFCARRPVNTSLSLEKYTALTGVRPRPWEKALEDYLRTYYMVAA